MATFKTGDSLKRLSDNERLGQDRDSEYLGSEDIDPGTEPILTIEGLWNGMVTLQRGKERKDVITFSERTVHGIRNVRPLIVNVTNRKTLKKLFGSVESNVLVGKKIQLYVDHKVRDPQDGGFTDGIRIRPNKPKSDAKDIMCAICKKTIKPAGNMTEEQLAVYTKGRFGQVLCADCARKQAEQQQEAQEKVNES